MTELAGTGLPLLEFDGPEVSDLGLFTPNVNQAQIDTNAIWMRQRREKRTEGDMLSEMSQRLYGDPNKWAEPPENASVNERINYGTDVGAARMFDDLERFRATTPGDFANYPTSIDDLRARASAQARFEISEEEDEATNSIANRSDPTVLGGVVSFAGQAVGYTADVEGVATLPLSGGSGNLARLVLLESAIGGVSTIADLPSRNAQADFLGRERPDPVSEVLMGMGFGGALPFAGRALRMGVNTLTPAGRVENRELLKWGTRAGATDEERGAATVLAREEASRDTAPAGVNPDEHAARIDAAERDLEDDAIRPDDAAAEATDRPEFDWEKHRSQGGTREDAISGLDAGFRTSLEDMILSAPPEIRDGFSVFSGYRSIERQQELWDASDKSGKMVARPGHSQHNHGQAVDLEWNGERLDKAPPEVQAWVADNLEKFGLTRPMDYEAWHIEPIGARGGKAAEPTTPRPVIEDGLVPPEEWAPISNGIFAGESGGDWDALFGYSNRPGGPFEDVKLTEMTVDEALAFSDPSGPYGQWVASSRPDPENGVATPMGAYQIVHTTLADAKDGLGLKGDELMTPELQEKLGQWIYLKQGTGAWQGYRGPRDGYTARGPGQYTGQGAGAASGFDARLGQLDPEVRAMLPEDFGQLPGAASRIVSDDPVQAGILAQIGQAGGRDDLAAALRGYAEARAAIDNLKPADKDYVRQATEADAALTAAYARLKGFRPSAPEGMAADQAEAYGRAVQDLDPVGEWTRAIDDGATADEVLGGSDFAAFTGKVWRDAPTKAEAGRGAALTEPASTVAPTARKGAASKVKPPPPRLEPLLSGERGVSTMLEGLTPAERKWLKAAYADGRLEQQPGLGRNTIYRFPREDSDARWQRAVDPDADVPPPRLTELPPDGGARIEPGRFEDPLEDPAETARLEGLERDLFARLDDPLIADLPIPRPDDEGGGMISLRAFAEDAGEEADFVDAVKTICLTKGARP